MSYGLKIYDDTGRIRVDVSDKLTRLRFYKILAPGESGSVNLPDFDSAKAGVHVYSGLYGHHVTISGTVISWSPFNDKYQDSSEIFVFYYK